MTDNTFSNYLLLLSHIHYNTFLNIIITHSLKLEWSLELLKLLRTYK